MKFVETLIQTNLDLRNSLTVLLSHDNRVKGQHSELSLQQFTQDCIEFAFFSSKVTAPQDAYKQ